MQTMTKTLSLLKALSVPLLLTFSVNVFANAIKPFQASYDLFRQGDKYGEGQRVLTELGDGRYSLELSSHLEWLIFSDDRTELSEFYYQNNKITPFSFLYSRTGTGKDKQLSISFAENQKLYVSPRPKKAKLPETWQDNWRDEMTFHMQVQQDLMDGKTSFEYEVVNKSGSLRQYKMEVIGKETIVTGAGKYEAIKVSRIYEEGKQTQLYAWFIPELNYTLSRLWRIKKGVEQYDLVLKEYKQL